MTKALKGVISNLGQHSQRFMDILYISPFLDGREKIQFRFMYPEKRPLVERILHIPQTRAQIRLIGFIWPDEIIKIPH